VWWEKGDVPATLVGHHDVVMSTAYNTRAYAALVSGAQLGTVWDQAAVYVNGWGVLKSARDQKAALEFVKFATDSARLSQLGEAMPYGPARRSALQGISPEMRAFSPTAPEHLEKAFMIDADFWQKNGLGLRNRFELWLAEGAKPERQASLGATPPAEKKPAADSSFGPSASTPPAPSETGASPSMPAATDAPAQP
jgi:putative spermidine/putrescine transport system substrate-binding protein